MPNHLAKTVSKDSISEETVRCPKCSKKLLFNPAISGEFCNCPECWHNFVMPVTEFALLLQIRNYTKATRFWTRLIFLFLISPFVFFVVFHFLQAIFHTPF